MLIFESTSSLFNRRRPRTLRKVIILCLNSGSSYRCIRSASLTSKSQSIKDSGSSGTFIPFSFQFSHQFSKSLVVYFLPSMVTSVSGPNHPAHTRPPQHTPRHRTRTKAPITNPNLTFCIVPFLFPTRCPRSLLKPVLPISTWYLSRQSA